MYDDDRRIIEEQERIYQRERARRDEEMSQRVKRSTEGPAHHIVQVGRRRTDILYILYILYIKREWERPSPFSIYLSISIVALVLFLVLFVLWSFFLYGFHAWKRWLWVVTYIYIILCDDANANDDDGYYNEYCYCD